MDTRESGGEEEETGPSVESNDAEERIAARKARITRRVEAERRAARGDDDDKKVEVKELTKSRKQMEASRQRLTKLKTDGTELVTNIRVAGDAREATRRVEEEEVKRQRKDKLDAEAKAGTDRFDEITKKWDLALQKEIPQELHEMLMQQKAACDAMVDEKNKLINEFQTELKQKDDLYVKDLKKQAEDIDLMIERMEEQIKQLTKAYREELNEIEAAFLAERRELLDANHKRWETQMQLRRDKEVDAMENREKRVEDYEQQLQHLRVQDAEEYNIVKIKLETDVQILEQQLQQMRATYQLNQEKLEYNFQVLKKRDEENTITKSQQKRKITRMQDVLNNLKIKLAKQEKQYKDENNNLVEDYKRITEQFKELQKKSKHFMSTDARKFHDVWLMNEAEAKELLNKVLEEDRLIHEHQLGLDWSPPDVSFTENVGPLVEDRNMEHGLPAEEVIKEIISQTSHVEGQDDPLEAPRSEILQKVSAHTIKRILELICDESGFLVEAKLKKLLSPLEKDERSLMGLDAIFSALSVDTEEDIQKLVLYFMIHVPGMKAAVSQTSLVQSEKSEHTDAASEDTDISPRSSNLDQAHLIHPNDVIKALRAFVDDNKLPQKDGKKTVGGFRIVPGEERDTSKDSEYWENYATVITPEKEKLWDALLDGLEKYSETLNGRSNLITETDALRQQNAELRMLLHQYVNSKVNQQLEIPPTRLLHMQLNQF